MIKKLLTFCYWIDRLAQSYQHFINKYCATEDDAKKRDSLLLILGNLAIIPQALNVSIRDAAWNVKKAGKGQNKPGLLLCASGLYTLHDVLQKMIRTNMK